METTELHESLKPLLPKEEMSKQNKWFEIEMNSNTEIIKIIKEWLLDIKEQCKGVDDDEVDSAVPHMTVITDEIGPNNSVSNVGGKRCTSASCSSHRSLKSSTSSAYLKAEAERAALLAKAATLKEKHELEVKEEQIRQKKEVLELQSEFARFDEARRRLQSLGLHTYGLNYPATLRITMNNTTKSFIKPEEAMRLLSLTSRVTFSLFRVQALRSSRNDNGGACKFIYDHVLL